jgi:hypothetical protein
MSAKKILGRVWFYGENYTIETFEYAIEPTGMCRRSGADWTREHLYECYKEKELRGLLEVPLEGDYQVLFKGEMDGCRSGYEYQESDEWFELEESKFEAIPKEYLECLIEKHEIKGG